MGQLTLLKNVPESGGGGFEKLYESKMGSIFGGYTLFPDDLKANILDYDLLQVVVTGFQFGDSSSSTQDEAMVSVSISEKYDEYGLDSVVIPLGSTNSTGKEHGNPMIVGIVFMGHNPKDNCAILKTGAGSTTAAETYATIPNNINFKKVGIRVQISGHSISGETKITIYGMGKRK